MRDPAILLGSRAGRRPRARRRSHPPTSKGTALTPLAFTLVLGSAFLHAGWNLLAKRAGGGAAFVWLFTALTAVLYAPAAIAFMVVRGVAPTGTQLLFTAGSAALHAAYFLALQRGYRHGDLSLVYPLARGSGPLLATVAAVALLGERPSALALGGTALIVLSVFVLSGGSGVLAPGRRAATLYGLLTGVFIASYTVWDGYAVSYLAIPPLLFVWFSESLRALLLTPLGVARRAEARRLWRERRREVIGVALLSPLAYLMVLAALTFTPISYVAPTREVSILIGTVMGARLLAEEQSGRRLVAASAMVVGVAMLVLG